MKLDSKLFDGIRIRSRQEEKSEPPKGPVCEWEGCAEPGAYKAPKPARAAKGARAPEYHHFCLDHVRHYNTAFNFFAGMKPEEMEAAVGTGARADAAAAASATPRSEYSGPRMPRGGPRDPEKRVSDPLHIFARYARAKARGPAPQARPRPANEQDRRAFEALGMTTVMTSDEIKKAYKTLVKMHHPDANGGDKASEDRLRSIIAAYSHLKLRGFVAR